MTAAMRRSKNGKILAQLQAARRQDCRAALICCHCCISSQTMKYQINTLMFIRHHHLLARLFSPQPEWRGAKNHAAAKNADTSRVSRHPLAPQRIYDVTPRTLAQTHLVSTLA